MKPRRPLIILPTLVLVNLALLFLSISQLLQTGVPTMTIEWGLIPISLTDSFVNGGLLDIGYDLLTLFTCTFLHGSFDHLLNNMLMLYLFGILVERQLGHWRFLTLYVASGILASLGHYVLAPMSPYPLIGASGAIAGVMGAFLVCVLTSGKRITVLPILGAIFIVQWVIEQAFAAMTTPARISGSVVAYDAHLAGFVAGLLVASLIVFRMRRQTPEETTASEDKNSPSSIDWQKLTEQVNNEKPAETAAASDVKADVLTEKEKRVPPVSNETVDVATESNVISAPTETPPIDTNAETSKAEPVTKRNPQTGYQPDRNDTLFD